MLGGVLGAGKECRYSGARRGIASVRVHWVSPKGVGMFKAIGWVSGDVGGVRSVFGAGRSVGTQGPAGV